MQKRGQIQNLDKYANGVYVCSCGVKEPNWKAFSLHILTTGKEEPGIHTSRGLFDKDTGELLMPPVRDRNVEQRKEARRLDNYRRNQKKKAQRVKDIEAADNDLITTKSDPVTTARGNRTTNFMDATLFRFTPRVLEVAMSPILIAAREAATNVLHWPADMTFSDFLDTWLWNSFNMVGIEDLGGYNVNEKLLKESGLYFEERAAEQEEQLGPDQGEEDGTPGITVEDDQEEDEDDSKT